MINKSKLVGIFSFFIFLLANINSFGSDFLLFQPENLNFEDCSSMPFYWRLPESMNNSGYSASCTNISPAEGIHCVKLSLYSRNDSTYPYGLLTQQVSAFAFRGKKIEFKAACRSTFQPDTIANSYIYLIINKFDDTFDFIELKENPIIGYTWKEYSMKVEIPLNAKSISYGVLLNDIGEVYFDDIEINIIQPENYKSNDNVFKNISEEQVLALDEFADLYSSVKYFSPSTENFNADWDALLLKGIDFTLNNYKKKESLVKEYSKLFTSVAPAIKIGMKTNFPEYKFTIPPTIKTDSIFGWVHTGAYSPYETEYFGSQLRNLRNSQRLREAAIIQAVNLLDYRKNTIELSAMMKFIPKDLSGRAELWLRVDREGGFVQSKRVSAGLNDTVDWNKQTISVELGDDVVGARIGIVMFGEGTLYTDDIKITNLTTNKNIEFNNQNFENPIFGQMDKNWNFPQTVQNAGYTSEYSEEFTYSGNRSIKLFSDDNVIKMPTIGDNYVLELPSGIKAAFPLCLPADSKGTYPKSNTKIDLSIENKPNGSYLASEDQLSRIAIYLDLYSYLKVFGKDLNDNIDMKMLFAKYLPSILKAKSDKDFLATLNNFTSEYKEPSLFIWKGWKENRFSYPFRWIIADDGKVLVSQTTDSLVATIGDEIISVNDIILKDLFKDFSAYGQYKNQIQASKIRLDEKDKKDLLKIKRKSGKIDILEVSHSTHIRNIEESRPPIVHSIDSVTVYMDLTALTDKEIAKNIDNLLPFKNFIFDLRGKTTVSPHLFGLFLENDKSAVRWEFPIYTMPNNSNNNVKKFNTLIKAKNKLKAEKIYFIANELSTGLSSDILLFAKENKIGKIIGRPCCFSKVETIYYNLPGLFSLSFPPGVAYFNNKKIGHVEIIPDILVNFNSENIDRPLPYFNEIMEDLKK